MPTASPCCGTASCDHRRDAPFDRDKHRAARWSAATCRRRSTASAADQRAAARPARVLSVQNLRMGNVVKNNSLSVFAGQITGVFGLIGSGRTETFKIVAGISKRDFMHGGEMLLDGRPVRYRVPATAVQRRHRLRHRGPQDRRLLRDHVDRRQYLPRACWPRPRGQRYRLPVARCERAGRAMEQAAQHHAPSTRTPRSSSCRAATSRRWSSPSR